MEVLFTAAYTMGHKTIRVLNFFWIPLRTTNSTTVRSNSPLIRALLFFYFYCNNFACHLFNLKQQSRDEYYPEITRERQLQKSNGRF
jgi:hypothetical protein